MDIQYNMLPLLATYIGYIQVLFWLIPPCRRDGMRLWRGMGWDVLTRAVGQTAYLRIAVQCPQLPMTT